MSSSSSKKDSSATRSSASSSLLLQQDLLETTQKVEASLQQAIFEHVTSSEFSPSQGLDFLDVKNSLLLSYLIELVYDFRNRLLQQQQQQENGNGNDRCHGRDDASLHRLIVMRTVLDKMRGLDKKLRYQIDKLLAAGTNSSTFATASSESNQQQQQQDEDPLQFRPDAAAMEQAANGNGDDSSSSDDDDDDNEQEGGEEDDDDDDDDDDLKAARRTVAMAREKKSQKSKQDDDEQGGDDANVYRAPRLAAVPYTQDKEDKQAQREKRRLGRMRASELAQTLRAQYGDQPEQDDIRGGGSDFGRQREAARRMTEREAEKTQFEEDTFVRLTTTRKEKKERQRLLRDESSNLGAIANLDNLIRDTQTYRRSSSGGGDDDDDWQDRKRAAAALADTSTYDNDGDNSRRHDNGKRKRQMFNADGRAMEKKGRKSLEARNSLQAALFGGGGGGGGKQSKKKKRNSY